VPKNFARNHCVLKAVERFAFALWRNTLLLTYQSNEELFHAVIKMPEVKTLGPLSMTSRCDTWTVKVEGQTVNRNEVHIHVSALVKTHHRAVKNASVIQYDPLKWYFFRELRSQLEWRFHVCEKYFIGLYFNIRLYVFLIAWWWLFSKPNMYQEIKLI